VVRQKQLQRDPTHLPDFLGSCSNNHPGSGGGRAAGDDSAAFDINQTKATRTVDAQLAMVAEGRDIDPRFSGDIEYVSFTFDRDRFVVDRHCGLHFHIFYPSV
jgi:hypothetical protein